MVLFATRSKNLSYEQKALVERHLPLVRLHLRKRVYATRRATRSREAEDLFQEGCVGLIRAAMSYDPATDGPFEPYALARIRTSVHVALYEGFATVRVPVGEIARRKAAVRELAATGLPPPETPLWARRLDIDLDALRPACADADAPLRDDGETRTSADAPRETIGQHVRDRLSVALRQAVERVAGRCRRADVKPILTAIVTERLLIPTEAERTALRAIGRRFGVSIGRAVAWQRAIEAEARAVLDADGEFQLLQDALSRAEGNSEASVNAELEAALARVRQEAFGRAIELGEVDRQERVAMVVYRAARRDPSAEARSLFAELDASRQREVLAAVGS